MGWPARNNARLIPTLFPTVLSVGASLAGVSVFVWLVRFWADSVLGGAAAAFATLPIAAMLTYFAGRRPVSPAPERPALADLLLAASALVFLAGAYLALRTSDAMMLCALALPPLGYGLLWRLRGREAARRHCFPIFFTYFALPFEHFLRDLDTPLQILSAELAVALLRAGGYAIEWWNAYTFYDTDFYLIVNETCSGMNLLTTLGMYTLVFGWLTDGLWLRRVALLALVPPLAMTINGLRVTVIWLMGKHGGEALAMGFWHTGSAYLLFLPVFWAIYAAGVFMRRRDSFARWSMTSRANPTG